MQNSNAARPFTQATFRACVYCNYSGLWVTYLQWCLSTL